MVAYHSDERVASSLLAKTLDFFLKRTDTLVDFCQLPRGLQCWLMQAFLMIPACLASFEYFLTTKGVLGLSLQGLTENASPLWWVSKPRTS